jgi:hypothetical protein
MDRKGSAFDFYWLEAVAVAATAWLAGGALRAELDLVWQTARLLVGI